MRGRAFLSLLALTVVAAGAALWHRRPAPERPVADTEPGPAASGATQPTRSRTGRQSDSTQPDVRQAQDARSTLLRSRLEALARDRDRLSSVPGTARALETLEVHRARLRATQPPLPTDSQPADSPAEGSGQP